MRSNLLSWQWQSYAVAHRDRRNLVLHLMTTPLFIAGTAAVVASPLIGGWTALAGLGAMLATLVIQGRGHRREASPPSPFTGPGDLVTRFFAEQLVNFPRFVLSGSWLRAWRAAGALPASER